MTPFLDITEYMLNYGDGEGEAYKLLSLPPLFLISKYYNCAKIIADNNKQRKLKAC